MKNKSFFKVVYFLFLLSIFISCATNSKTSPVVESSMDVSENEIIKDKTIETEQTLLQSDFVDNQQGAETANDVNNVGVETASDVDNVGAETANDVDNVSAEIANDVDNVSAETTGDLIDSQQNAIISNVKIIETSEDFSDFVITDNLPPPKQPQNSEKEESFSNFSIQLDELKSISRESIDIMPNPNSIIEPEILQKELKSTEKIFETTTNKDVVVKKIQRKSNNQKQTFVVENSSDKKIDEESHTKNTSSIKRKTSKKQEINAIIAEPEVTVALLDDKKLNEIDQKNELSPDDLLKKAYDEYEKNNYEEALKYLDLFFVKSTTRLDEGWFLRGNIYEDFFDLGNIKNAKESYETLINLYPQSNLWQEAKKRIIYIDRFYFNVW